MSARIRGHYRVDDAGRVLPVLDVNASLGRFAYHSDLKADQEKRHIARMKKISFAGLGTAILGIAMMASLPTIQRLVVAHQSAQYAIKRQEVQNRRLFPSGHRSSLPQNLGS